MEDLHLPIALRRTPRRAPPGEKPSEEAVVRPVPAAVARTPSRRAASRKRVRFSDPGPAYGEAASTGLTPMVRRASLGTTAPSPKRRRASAPGRTAAADADVFGTPGRGAEVRIVPPLRQVLDDRVKRRIRRNGLSEEMNAIDDEKKQRARAHEAEMERLRGELAARDAEIERLRDATVFQDTDRIVELGQQVEQLRAELRSRSDESAAPVRPGHGWALATRRPFGDGYYREEGEGENGDEDEGDEEDDEFGDTTMQELVCSTPTRETRTSLAASRSFPSPPCTSPTIPASPCSTRPFSPPQLPSRADATAQADLPDPEKAAAEAELASLRRELHKLTGALEEHEAARARLAAKLAAAVPGGDASTSSAPGPDDGGGGLEATVDGVLRSLADKTAALAETGASLVNLGFAGRDAGEVLASLVSGFRAARLELEYLTPGEVALPLDSRGAEVLDLVLTRLRGLARRVREQGDALDAGDALGASLRQQLAARVQAMDGLKRELQRELGRKAARLRDRDARIAELELAAARLRGDVEGYRRAVAVLEDRVQVQADEAAAAAAGRVQQQAEEEEEMDVDQQQQQQQQEAAEAAQRAATLGALEEQLAAAHAQRRREIRALNDAHGQTLAQRDARVTALRRELDHLHAALRAAQATVCALRVRNAALAAGRAAATKAELERLLARPDDAPPNAAAAPPPATAPDYGRPGPVAAPRRSSARLRGGSLAGGPTTLAGGRTKRRHDSGLGLVGEEDVDF